MKLSIGPVTPCTKSRPSTSRPASLGPLPRQTTLVSMVFDVPTSVTAAIFMGALIFMGIAVPIALIVTCSASTPASTATGHDNTILRAHALANRRQKRTATRQALPVADVTGKSRIL
jgi:hypothetical protein